MLEPIFENLANPVFEAEVPPKLNPEDAGLVAVSAGLGLSSAGLAPKENPVAAVVAVVAAVVGLGSSFLAPKLKPVFAAGAVVLLSATNGF